MHPEIVTDTQGPIFFWNVDAAVGLHGANNFDDVMFVQWCFYKLSKWDRIPADLRKVLAQTPVSGSCTGRDNDPLVTSIKAFQASELMTGMVDGRVSPAKGGGYYKYYGDKQAFLILRLNGVLRVLHPQQYPRIDLMPEFIWRIRDQVKAPFI